MIAEGVILEQEAESAGAEISVIFFQGKNMDWISLILKKMPTIK